MKYCCKLDIDDMVITSNEVIEKDNGIPQFDHIIFILKREKRKRKKNLYIPNAFRMQPISGLRLIDKDSYCQIYYQILFKKIYIGVLSGCKE